MLKNKSIIVGVTGGIAAYKSVELVRLFQKAGARDVRVIMTENACKFVGPITFEAICKNAVCTSLFEQGTASVKHIEWAESSDLVVIAPATANIIAKIAHGIADDALSTFMLAVSCPVLICPAMNTKMWENPIVQSNIKALSSRKNINVLMPDTGDLACGTSGQGRLPSPEIIFDRVNKLTYPSDYSQRKVLVTAGPTLEPIDPVRFISNPSSGKMGYAIAKIAEYRGASVTLISGPTLLPDPIGVKVIKIKTAKEMETQVFDLVESSDIIIKAAAVADYRVESPADQKIKKKDDEMTLRLIKNTDILKEAGKRKRPNQILVGFAAETQNLDTNASTKLREKNLDMIVGNLIGSKESGFAADTNIVSLFFPDKNKESLPLMSKEELANIILDRIKS